MVASHATVRGPQFFGADSFDKSSRSTRSRNPVAQMIQLTGMIFEGVPEKLPAPADRLHGGGMLLAAVLDGPHDEEWAKRGAVEAPLCRRRPSEYLRSGNLYFASEGDEKSVPEAVRRLGDDIIFLCERRAPLGHDYPANVHELATRKI